MGDTEKYFEIRNFYGFIPTSQIGASQIEVRRIKGILETLTNLILRILRNWRELILTAKFCCNYVTMFIKVLNHLVENVTQNCQTDKNSFENKGFVQVFALMIRTGQPSTIIFSF